LATTLTPDLCVIGAGASGLAVAIAARRLGASVVVAEKGVPGGMSAKSGALALRALAAAAERAAAMTSAEPFGVFGESAKVSLRKVHDHIAAVSTEKAADDGPARLAAQGIELVTGVAAFTDPSTVKVGDATIRARRFVIATGARTLVPDLPGLFSVPWFTPETIFDNTRKLTHLVVIGAGPKGLELALSYRRLGAEVTVVEPGKALVEADPELAEIGLRRLRDEGVTLHEGSVVVAIHARGQGIGVDIRAGDEMTSLDASHILVASGRAANLAELNLDAAKVRRSKNDPGALALLGSLRTTNAKVYAVGEAAGHAPAAHLASSEADLVTRAALLGQPTRYDPASVPRLTLTDPPIAEIGLSEPMARGRFKTGYSVFRASYSENDAARAALDGMGLVKLIVAKDGRILGAGVVGARAAELIALVGLAMSAKLPAARLAEFAAPYPSYAELIRTLGEQAAPIGIDTWTKRRFALWRLLP
jgi:pyruvate/2-oxoglutarate dehydrogenase complex dihydrolipoamide dehydrogenase (E3) component